MPYRQGLPGSSSGSSHSFSTSPSHPPNTASTSVTTPSSQRVAAAPEDHELTTPSHRPGSRRRGTSPSRKSQAAQAQAQAPSPSKFDNSQLEYYTNNSFSRSFNSLILDDIKDELVPGTSAGSAPKKKINKSPPFNIKKDYTNDRLDDYPEEEDVNILDVDLENDADDDDDDDEYLGRHEVSLVRRPHIKERPSATNLGGRNRSRSSSGHGRNQGAASGKTHSHNSSLSHTHKKSEDLILGSEGDDAGAVQSQQSSIKRSSKFLNLSIDSNLRSMNSKVTEDLDYISDLNEIDSSIIKPTSASISREPTPIENSSPITSRNAVINSSSNNKFKRPHKLVSQSPSPSSTKINASKAMIYQFNKSPEQAANPGTASSLYTRPTSHRMTSNDSLDYYSPSKLGRKGFKMFKNADKDAIISPNRSTPERPTRVGLSIFADRKQPPASASHPSSSSKLLTSNKLRKTSLNYNKSPFHRQSSSPISNNFEYYNIDDMEFDSPSKNRKLSNGSNNSIVIYQDDPVSAPVSARKVHGATHPHPINHSSFSPTPSAHNPGEFDDKENKSSYRFVKPLQTAFKSTGLVKKNSISKESRKLPPETPIKKNPLMLISTNKSSLSNIISSAHEEMMDDNSEISIEVGRNNISAYNSTLNESNSSFFRIPSTNNSSQKTTHLNILNNADLDIDLSSDIEVSIPETPTKSVKKSHSTPANFSPVSFKKTSNKLSNFKNSNKLSISTASLDSFPPPTSKYHEPSTPTNMMHKGGILPSKNHSNLHHQLLDSAHKNNASNPDESSYSLLAREEDDNTLTAFNKSGFIDADQSESMIPHTQETVEGDSKSTRSKIDDHLIDKFGMKNIKYIGAGEFSIAYECIFQNQKLAIKRSKKPIIGKSERKAILREIEALRALTSVKDNESVNLQEQEEGKDYLVYFIEAWDFNNYYYIMTEFCDNGTLFDFLEEHKNYKIDEFRIWKILIEILSGLSFIHSKNYLHLDLKPANIFITFEGTLKIGDFGLTTKLPILEKDFDLEGDRNYIAPELINDKIYTPFADIFSLGLIILEIAANIILPDNGTPWRKLRSGDLSDAGKLSSDNISDFLQHQNFSSLTSYNTNMNFSSNQSMNLNSSTSNLTFNAPPSGNQGSHGSDTCLQQPAQTTANARAMKGLIPSWAPDFLVSGDSMNLDKLVNKMLRPNPFDRPNAKMILAMEECSIIENRRKAGATIFEGEFGPNLDEDEMAP